MKNLTVRLSDLDHKRLTEQAIKKGGDSERRNARHREPIF